MREWSKPRRFDRNLVVIGGGSAGLVSAYIGSVVPWATFTDPEIARVGFNETEARERNIAFEVTTYRFDELDRAITDADTCGFVKVLTARASDRILGATIAGEHAWMRT